MGGKNITSIKEFRKDKRTVVDICLSAVQDMEAGPRLAMTNTLEDPSEDLKRVLENVVKLSERPDVDLKDALFPGVMGYFMGMSQGKDEAMEAIKKAHVLQLRWLEISLKNRFDLADDDVLLEVIDKMKASNSD